jgi:hypothetical protein
MRRMLVRAWQIGDCEVCWAELRRAVIGGESELGV